MSLKTRTYCLGSDNTVYWLPHTRYDNLLFGPAARPIPQFADQFVRCAEVFLEVQGQRRIRVISMNCYALEFDDRGLLNREDILRGAVERVSPVLGDGNHAIVVRADWTPSKALRALIRDIALGTLKARRL